MNTPPSQRQVIAKLVVVVTAVLTLCSCSNLPSEDSVKGFVYNVLHGWQQNKCTRTPGDASMQGTCYKGTAGYDEYKKARDALSLDSDKPAEPQK